MSAIPIALQLYSVREECGKDFLGTIAKVAAMGYKGVEFAGYYDTPASEIRKCLDDNGLEVAGVHTGSNTLNKDNLAATVDFNRELGNDLLVLPWLGEDELKTKDALKATIAMLQDIADRVTESGMRFAFHNHMFEFECKPFGVDAWDTIFTECSGNVLMQVDTGNCTHGGGDPVKYIKKYSSIAPTVHLKSWNSAKPETVIGGEGDEVKWNDVFAACDAAGGVDWYIVEQERYPVPPMEAVKQCIDNIQSMFAAKA